MTAPLLHKRILITRPKGQVKEMARLIVERGGIPVELPLLHTVQAELGYIALHTYDWLIFTSKNGVQHFFSQVTERLPAALQIAAVGVKTKRAIEEYGYEVHFVPRQFVGEAFVTEFAPLLSEHSCILFPRGDLARDVVPAGLRQSGAYVDERIVYETKPYMQQKERLIQVLESGAIDVITFTSPSAVAAFLSLLEGVNWRQWVKRCTIGCIGPITAEAAAAHFTSVAVAGEYTVEGLLSAIAGAY